MKRAVGVVLPYIGVGPADFTFYPFREGMEVELVQCPPAEYRYGDYIVEKHYWRGRIGNLAILQSSTTKDQIRLVNMTASTVVEIRTMDEKYRC